MLPPPPSTPMLDPPGPRPSEADPPGAVTTFGDGTGLAERETPSPSGSIDPTHRELAMSRHWPELDGIRGLAVMAVVIYHFAGMIPPEMCRQSQAWDLVRRMAGS